MTKSRLAIRFVGYLFLVILFLICGFIVIAYATGYKIDLKTRDITQTAIIDVQTDVRDASIFINDELRDTGRATIRNVEPGIYDVKVLRDGYHSWEKRITVTAGEAAVLNDVVLFKTNPKVTNFTADINRDQLFKLADTDNLVLQNGEIYQNSTIITRFFSNVSSPSWYPDRRYIAFTNDKKAKIIEIDGTNQVELVDKNSDTPIVFVNSGRMMIYENGGKIYQAEIR